ncbi:MAG: alpha-amylase [Syntrophus sp. (in: bacteria)]|nr:alpha-amylase [Syntrophus sp. (in: bacteria)]
MPVVCLYFQAHQPRRLRPYSYFDINHVSTYEDAEANRLHLNKAAQKCYLPANRILLEQIRRHKGAFRLAFSLTGVLLEQLEKDRPDVLDSFRELADTGCVEFLNETYCHSLAFLFSRREFKQQVLRHKRKIKSLFGRTPTTFRHTELIYNNDLAHVVEKMGYRAILAEGAERILNGRTPDRVYRPAGCHTLKLLLRNYRLSDDIAFCFSDRSPPEYPLTAQKFAERIHRIDADQAVVNLFMDYETFGEHHWADSGIFRFLESLPAEILKHSRFRFQTPGEAAASHDPVAALNAPDTLSWADREQDLTAWMGSAMQKDAVQTLYKLEAGVRGRHDRKHLQNWRMLQTSDHFYYMCTKRSADGDVHRYFNPYPSPYDAYINYMNILDDFSRRLKQKSMDANEEGRA